jgi:glutamate-5-semialdehyde dehydrogenase
MLQVDYPAACNAAETLLLHESTLTTLWPKIAHGLLAADVVLYCEDAPLRALSELSSSSPPNLATHLKRAEPDSFDTEHLSLALSVKAVPSLDAAMAHVNAHGSHHTDCIVTEDAARAERWCAGVDSAGAFVNASTRFADGFRYGFGTEVGIATGRIHARGPVGLDGLCTYKYVLRSTSTGGHVVGEFGAGPDKKQYSHTNIQGEDVHPF